MIRRIAAVLLCAMLAALWMAPAAMASEEGGRIVRVGWYDTPFNQTDSFGRRTGYGYEYQRKIAAYTGWKYEYVEANWYELLQMLEDGRIDLLSDVSFTEERKDKMLFSSFPMGTELYYLYADPDNEKISREDITTLNGKRIGVTRSTIEVDFLRQWIAEHGILAEVIELGGTEEESLKMVKKGEIDAFVTMDYYGDPDRAVPIWKIGASDSTSRSAESGRICWWSWTAR